MMSRLLIVAVAVAVALTACATNSEVSLGAEGAAYSKGTGYAESLPPTGEPFEYSLYTHCGVERLRLGGRWWHAVEPLYGDLVPGSPPEGWDDPQAGQLIVESEQSVIFKAKDTRVKFVPADDDRPLRMCR